MKFIIDPELKALIPPLSKEEYKQLKENILEWGCLDPLKVWPVPNSEKVILLDGHNRFAICRDNNVSYVTESVALSDRAAAIDWMIANQLGRRNLSAEQMQYLRGMQYQQEKQEVTNPDGIGGKSGKIDDAQNEQHQSKGTADRLAKQHGVSNATIRRNAEYAQAVDAIAKASSPEVRQQILSGEFKLTQSTTLKLAKIAEQDLAVMPDILEEIRQAPNKTTASAIVQKATSKTKETSMNKETARLMDFDNATDGINWLKGRFTLAELSESLARQTSEEEAEALAETDEFFDDEED